MRAMVSSGPGSRSPRRPAGARPGRAGASGGRRLRRLPHRSPRGGRRAPRSRGRRGSRPRDRRHRRRARQRGTDPPRRRPGRRALAGRDLRQCRTAARGRENLCSPARSPVTRSTAATPSTRWPTRATASRCPRVLATSRPPPAVRRADRLPGAGMAGEPAGSASTASAPRPTSSRRSRATGAEVSSRSPAGDPPPGVRPRARCRWAGGGDERAARGPRAALIFAPVGALVPSGAARGRARAAPSSAAAST